MKTRTRQDAIAEYKRLGDELRNHHKPPMRFFNHCFWRIANDYVVGQQWDRVIRSPFIEHASNETLAKSVSTLNSMFNEQVLKDLNQISLRLRGHQPTNHQ